MKWKYYMTTMKGHHSAAVDEVNEYHPEWDVVSLYYDDGYISIIYRMPRVDAELAEIRTRKCMRCDKWTDPDGQYSYSGVNAAMSPVCGECIDALYGMYG